MFSLTREEIRNLSQIVISSGIKHAPNVFAFTEQGVAMLSGAKIKNRTVLFYDVHEKNLGYDITSLHLNSGESRLIEVKGIAGDSGTVLLTPNERRVAEDRRDCYWLYIVTNCKQEPKLQDPVKDPARLKWHEVKKVDHYYLSVDALIQPMQIKEDLSKFGKIE